MDPKIMTETEIVALAARTQDYIDRLHEFAQEEAEKADIPARIAVPAVIGWAIGIARNAGIEITAMTAEMVGPDKPPYH
jgi:hypothetical protein